MRWLAGGTGAGKSTAAAALARRFELDVYAGDRAEHGWLARCTPEQHPHLAAAREQRPGDTWRDRSPEEVFDSMAGRHGETIGFLVEDLRARPRDRLVLVDYFGVLPRDLAPLLSSPTHVVFLIPSPAFRRDALRRRYADVARSRANWGGLDPAQVLEARLARDALWDAEVCNQATELGLSILTIDGGRPPEVIADEIAVRFQLGPTRSDEGRPG